MKLLHRDICASGRGAAKHLCAFPPLSVEAAGWLILNQLLLSFTRQVHLLWIKMPSLYAPSQILSSRKQESEPSDTTSATTADDQQKGNLSPCEDAEDASSYSRHMESFLLGINYGLFSRDRTAFCCYLKLNITHYLIWFKHRHISNLDVCFCEWTRTSPQISRDKKRIKESSWAPKYLDWDSSFGATGTTIILNTLKVIKESRLKYL